MTGITPAVAPRPGHNYGKQPAPESETPFNILAPGVVESHYTLRGTWNIDKSNEVNFAFMYPPTETVQSTGANPLSALTGASFLPNGNADISLMEFSFGLPRAGSSDRTRRAGPRVLRPLAPPRLPAQTVAGSIGRRCKRVKLYDSLSPGCPVAGAAQTTGEAIHRVGALSVMMGGDEAVNERTARR